MKSNREPLFPPGIADETAAILSEFLHSLASACDSHYFIKLRRHYSRQQELFDPDHPWITRPPDQ